jgi:hypothetical protein
MMAILFGLRPISTLMTGSFIYHNAQSIEPQFAQTVVLALTGTAAFVIAYEICTPIRTSGPVDRENRSAHLDMSSIYAYAAVISAVGIALFAAHLSRAGGVLKMLRLMAAGQSQQLVDSFAGSSEYLSSAPVLLACAAIVLVVATRGHLSATARIFVFAAAAVSALLFFLLGARRYMLPCLAIPVVAYYLARQRQPSRKLVLIVVPIAFVLLATIPYQRVSGGREQGGGAIPIFREGLARPVDSWKRFITGPDTEMFSALAVEVGSLSKPSDFAYGKATLGDLALAPIPSAVFPGKPTTARNQMLTKAFGTPCEAFGGLCPDFSVIGTFYQDLSYLGVVVGMAALGAASGLIWRRYRRDPTDPFSVLLAATWTVHLPILIRAGFMPSFAWFLYFLLPSLLGLGIATSRGPRVRVPPVATLAAGDTETGLHPQARC